MSLQIGPATAATVRGHDTEGMTPVRLDIIEGPGLCACGCGGAVKQGYHPDGRPDKRLPKHVKGHNVRSGPVAFWDRVPHGLPADVCWEWTGPRHAFGYGRQHHLCAHRMMYEHVHGPIPDGLFVCHTCDNPPCVNPAHLFLGTPADNMQDMARKGRSRPGRAKLTAEDVEAIRSASARGDSRQELGQRFAVTPDHIGQIVRGTRR
jgi:hypothetical protein